MSVATTLHWILRVAICMEFVGHGAFGIIGKEAWVPYFSVFGFTDSQAWTLMPLVGAVDISLGVISLFRPTRAVLLHMTLWGLMTAMLRPATGEPIWELFERGGNYAVPLAFLFLVGGGGRSFKGWFANATPTLNRITAQRMGWTLRIGTALLLVGHGGFGAFMHREAWTGYFAELGVAPETVASADLASLVGWFEIALGLAVLSRPARSLLVFVVGWKIGTEYLRPLAGEPMWEFIERGGSYAAPLALLYVQRYLRRFAGGGPERPVSKPVVTAPGTWSPMEANYDSPIPELAPTASTN
jgi:hypothetical protein